MSQAKEKKERNKVIKIKTRVNPRNTQSDSSSHRTRIFMTFREEQQRRQEWKVFLFNFYNAEDNKKKVFFVYNGILKERFDRKMTSVIYVRWFTFCLFSVRWDFNLWVFLWFHIPIDLIDFKIFEQDFFRFGNNGSRVKQTLFITSSLGVNLLQLLGDRQMGNLSNIQAVYLSWPKRNHLHLKIWLRNVLWTNLSIYLKFQVSV